MTNLEYESRCIIAAAAPNRAEGERKLACCDAQIADAEKALVFLLHSRREIINNYDLNKPSVGERLRAAVVKGHNGQRNFNV